MRATALSYPYHGLGHRWMAASDNAARWRGRPPLFPCGPAACCRRSLQDDSHRRDLSQPAPDLHASKKVLDAAAAAAGAAAPKDKDAVSAVAAAATATPAAAAAASAAGDAKPTAEPAKEQKPASDTAPAAEAAASTEEDKAGAAAAAGAAGDAKEAAAEPKPAAEGAADAPAKEAAAAPEDAVGAADMEVEAAPAAADGEGVAMTWWGGGWRHVGASNWEYIYMPARDVRR